MTRGVWRYSVRAGTRPEASLEDTGHGALPVEPSAETVVMWAELAAWGHGTRDTEDTPVLRDTGTRRDTAARG